MKRILILALASAMLAFGQGSPLPITPYQVLWLLLLAKFGYHRKHGLPSGFRTSGGVGVDHPRLSFFDGSFGPCGLRPFTSPLRGNKRLGFLHAIGDFLACCSRIPAGYLRSFSSLLWRFVRLPLTRDLRKSLRPNVSYSLKAGLRSNLARKAYYPVATIRSVCKFGAARAVALYPVLFRLSPSSSLSLLEYFRCRLDAYAQHRKNPLLFVSFLGTHRVGDMLTEPGDHRLSCPSNISDKLRARVFQRVNTPFHLLYFTVFSLISFAQSPLPITPYQVIQTNNGVARPCQNCAIYTYAAGTTTPLATYSDSTLGTTLPNPVRTNSAGYAVSASNAITGIWIGNACYKIILKDASAVTLWTQDHVCNPEELVLLLLAGPTGASYIGYNLGVTGSQNTTVQNELRQHYELKADFGAVGDGTTNDSAALLAAVTAAQTGGMALHVPGGTFAITDVESTNAGNFSLVCDGPKQTTFKRHSSALQASTPLLKLTNAASVNLSGCGWNELGNGTNYTNAASTVYLATVGDVTIDNNYSTLAQSNAFIIAGSTGPVKFTRNTCTYFWNACLAASGSGTVASPAPINGIVVSDNACSHGLFCALVTVFVNDLTMTGNTAKASTFSLVQHVNHSTITSNVSDGAVDYGLGSGGSNDCFFLEGVSYFTMSGNHAYGCTRDGIRAQGSQLTVTTTEQLPIQYASIEGNDVQGAAAYGIDLVGWSFDHSLIGSNDSIRGNFIYNSGSGIAAAALDNFDVSSNTLDTLGANGIDMSVVRNGRLEGNRIFRPGQTTSNTYYGIKIGNDDTTATHDLFIDHNLIADSTGKMRDGVNNDALGTGGYQNLVRHCGNIISGQVAGNLAWAPQPVAPTSGTWLRGDCIENFPTAVNKPTGWINTVAGTPGTWSRTGTVIGPNCAAVADGSNNVACGASAAGYFTIAAGSNFANVFTTAQLSTSVINVTQTGSADVGTLLGVTCNTTFSGSYVQSTLNSGGRFTVNVSASAPVTNPACYQFSIQNNQ